MQPPIFTVIGQRLVPRIDDRAVELHPLVDVVNDVISPLTKLKIYVALLLWRLKVKGQWVRLSDPAGAGENLARCQECQQRSENRWRELRLAPHQVILVATEGCPGVMIHIVLDERDPVFRPEGNER